MRKIRFYLTLAAMAVLIVSVIMAVVKVLAGPDRAKIMLNIAAEDGYQEELLAAMDVWNRFVGCEFLVSDQGLPIDTLVKSGDGAPCNNGVVMRPEEEWGHAATAYRCGDGTHQILIERPGHTNTQAAIIAHEIGHRLGNWGVSHNAIGVMSNPSASRQNVLRIRDQDAKSIKDHFCYE